MNETLITLIPILIICHKIKFQLNKNDELQEYDLTCFASFSYFLLKKKKVKNHSSDFFFFFSLPSLPVSVSTVFFYKT